jgi:hypothetical protein
VSSRLGAVAKAAACAMETPSTASASADDRVCMTFQVRESCKNVSRNIFLQVSKVGGVYVP